MPFWRDVCPRRTGPPDQADLSSGDQGGGGNPFWIEKREKHIIVDSSQDGVYDLTLSDGDNYIVMEGDGLEATLKIEIE